MFFSGMLFGGGKYSLDYTPTNYKDINIITIQNGIYDDLYISKNTNLTPSTIVNWDIDTLLHASFQNSLIGGNVEYSVNQVSSIRIKRRVKNTYNWITLFDIPIHSSADFQFSRDEFLNRAKEDYEYAFVPVLNDVEGNMSTNSIFSDFEGLIVLDKERVYQAILEAQITETSRPNNNGVFNTMGRKYPYVIKNNINNYESGSAQGMFVEFNTQTGEFDLDNAIKYRNGLKDWLNNGTMKIVKLDDGRMWLVNIVDDIRENSDPYCPKVITTFNFVEDADCESQSDLYNANLIDVGLR